MQPDHIDLLRRALARGAADLPTSRFHLGEQDVEGRLKRLTRAAVDTVPGADEVGLTLLTGDRGLESHAPTSPQIAELDRLQIVLGDGPGHDALAGGTAVVEPSTAGASPVLQVIDFGEESWRWPGFCQAAVDHGICSLVSFAIAPTGASPGVINFYSRTRDGFDATAKTIAAAFATQAAYTVYGAARVADPQQEVPPRDVIGRATRILMERHRTDSGCAFDVLVNASRDTNITLTDVAGWLVEDISAPTVAATTHESGSG